MAGHRLPKRSSRGAKEDDSDSISVTSTRASEDDTEKSYFVERILAEDIDRDQNMFYLIQWEGYPITESTWEPEQNIEEQKTFDDWEEEKRRISEGLSEPFDLVEFEAQVAQLQREKNDRRRRRRAKRKRLGISVSLSNSDSEAPVPSTDDYNSDSSTEAEEVGEEPEDAPGITGLPRRSTSKSRLRSKGAIAGHGDKTRVDDPVAKNRNQEESSSREQSQGRSSLENHDDSDALTSDDSLVGEILDRVARRKARQTGKPKSDQQQNPKRKSETAAQSNIGEVYTNNILLMRGSELTSFTYYSP
jgi:chromo domain-containing protein 1